MFSCARKSVDVAISATNCQQLAVDANTTRCDQTVARLIHVQVVTFGTLGSERLPHLNATVPCTGSSK
jgi:hypothetical protein